METKISKRKTPAPGISYLDANSHRLITIQDDVLGIKKRIEDTWPELRVYFDTEAEEWVITQIDRHNTESLLFTTPSLSEATMLRIQQAEADPWESIQKAEAEADREHERRVADLCGDVGERLAHAFARDGLTVRSKISTFIPNRERTNRRATVRG